jgi:hypothetical protein
MVKNLDLQVFKPSPGLERGTASLPRGPGGNRSQPRATDFRAFEAFLAPLHLRLIATGCARCAP